MYGSLLDRSWDVFDVLEHTEQTVHRVVRRQNPGASPPRLSCERRGPKELVIRYDSRRRMCAIAKGIVRGLGRHFRVRLELAESACMQRGDDACLITVRGRA
jgi:hypothetical protein